MVGGRAAGPDQPLRVHRAGPKDLDELTVLFEGYRVFYKETSDPKGARRFLAERIDRADSVIFLARRADRAVGFVQLYPAFDSTRMGRIWILNDLFVVPEARRGGVGSRLLDRAKELAEESGAIALLLETAVDNPAQRLYEAHGWKLDRQFLHYAWERPVPPGPGDRPRTTSSS